MKNFWSSLQGKIVGWLIVLAIIMGIYAEAILAYKNTEDAKTATEIANNAAKLKLAEAEERAQLAKKAAAEAETARATAEYAGKLKLAEAQKVAADAETAAAIAKNSAERQQAETDDAKAKARYDTADANIQEYVSGILAHPSGKGLAADMTNATLPKGLGGHGSQATAQPDEFQPSQLSPKCRTLWTKWQGFIHGAFATTTTDDCVMNGTQDFRGTKQGAIASLRKTCAQSGQSCEVIASK